MNKTLEAIADLLNQHIQSFQAKSATSKGGTQLTTTSSSGNQVTIPFQINRSTTTRRTIR